MSVAKQRQGAITATWKNGKDGYLAAISESALNYSADPTMLPSEFGELSAKQAVANYGGYFVAHKGWTAEFALGFANAIAKRYEELNKSLSASGDELEVILKSVDEALTREHEDKARQALFLGDTTESLAKRLKALSHDLVIANATATTPKAQFLVREAIAQLQGMLSPVSGDTVETTEKVLIA